LIDIPTIGQTVRLTDRPSDGQTVRLTDRPSDGQTHSPMDSLIDSHTVLIDIGLMDIQTLRWTHTIVRYTDTRSNRQTTVKWTDRQSTGQTKRQMDRHEDR
jgi:hypothetical protein